MNVVIHGHFYQPPRFNPWTGRIPRQERAHPAHDWNARVADECYRPNGASRVRGAGNRITEIVNNYAYMNFDFGPTLLAWLEQQAPETYRQVLAGDRLSRQLQDGHGNAIAQAYNHMILPLANRRDKQTQVIWGLRDFARRFGRPSESLWLPETAVDRETVAVLIEQGVRYIVLAPSQARRVRMAGQRGWTDVRGGRIDPRRAYRYRLRDARGRAQGDQSLAVFFYDGSLAGEISFGHLLRSAPVLGERLRQVAEGIDPVRGFVSVATDGEVYGHHEPFADMCFSYLARREAPGRRMRLTNYGRLLAEHSPEDEVDLDFGEEGRGTAWSCAHGVGRWMRDCGCSTGGQPGWNQTWREPLRAGCDALRERLAEAFEDQVTGILRDPWAARDDYVDILLDRSPGNRRSFLDRHAARAVTDVERVRIWRLLESQRYAMYMYTSCGWFFADISGVEPVQNMVYAARAIELAQPGVAEDLESVLLERLAAARSNLEEPGSGADIYRRFVQPQRVRTQVAAGEIGLTAAVRGADPAGGLLGQELLDWEVIAADSGDGAVHARLTLRDPATEERSVWGIHVFGAATPDARVYVRAAAEDAAGSAYAETASGAGAPGRAATLPMEEALRGQSQVARIELRDLISEEREATIRVAFREALIEAERTSEGLFDSTRRLMETLRVSRLPVPEGLRANARDVLARRIGRLAEQLADAWSRELTIESGTRTRGAAGAGQGRTAAESRIALDAIGPDALLDRIASLLDFARSHRLEVPTAALVRGYGRVLEEILRRLRREPAPELLRRFVEIARSSYPLHFLLDRRPLEDLAFRALRAQRATIREQIGASASGEIGESWEAFADCLGLELTEIVNLADDSQIDMAAPQGAHEEDRR